ncbi:tetratricopeptide repeat protein [Spirochaeta dissipatitropha]
MKQFISFLLITVITASVLSLASCDSRDPIVDTLIEMEADLLPGQQVSDARMREIEREVARYRDIVDSKVQANGQLMIYYRMLGIRYMEREMFGPAMDALEQALAITPANAHLHSHYATAAAQSAKARYNQAERQQLFTLAEKAYLRAIELDPNHVNSLYGIAVLLGFELERLADALPHLNHLITIRRNHIEARFVRAYVHAGLGNMSEAMADYDAIMDISPNPEYKRQAADLRAQLSGGGL